MSETIEAGVFRDGREGARARRDHLLRKRRDEYARLPHAVRRVFVRRVARAITGATAAFGAAALMLCAWSPALRHLVRNLVPGRDPAVLSTLLLATWIVIAWVYFAARALAEDRFARATARTVRPSADLYADLDRLARLKPDDVAARMAARVEGASIAWPLIGLGMLMPLTAAFAMLWGRAGAFPNPASFDDLMVRRWATMAPSMAVIAALAWWTARRLCTKKTLELAAPGRGGDSAALFIGALLATTFAAAVGLGTVLVGVALVAFVVVAHVATGRVLRERLALETI